MIIGRRQVGLISLYFNRLNHRYIKNYLPLPIHNSYRITPYQKAMSNFLVAFDEVSVI